MVGTAMILQATTAGPESGLGLVSGLLTGSSVLVRSGTLALEPVLHQGPARAPCQYSLVCRQDVPHKQEGAQGIAGLSNLSIGLATACFLSPGSLHCSIPRECFCQLLQQAWQLLHERAAMPFQRPSVPYSLNLAGEAGSIASLCVGILAPLFYSTSVLAPEGCGAVVNQVSEAGTLSGCWSLTRGRRSI